MSAQTNTGLGTGAALRRARRLRVLRNSRHANHSNSAITTTDHGIAGVVRKLTTRSADQIPPATIVRASANAPSLINAAVLTRCILPKCTSTRQDFPVVRRTTGVAV